jgi:hypothetical protein
MTTTTEEVERAVADINIEIQKLNTRLRYLREKKMDLVMQAHGLVKHKTVVRGTADGRPTSFGKEYLVIGVEGDILAVARKPWVIGVLTTRYGTSKNAKSVCLRGNWEIVSAEELALEKV